MSKRSMGMSNVEHAVILAAGRGKRLRQPDPSVQLDPAVEAVVRQGFKALVPIHGRAFMDYIVERLMEAGIHRVCLIVAPDADPLIRYVSGLSERFPGLSAQYVVQPEPLGTAHALLFARPVTGDRDFLILNSDDLYPVNALHVAVEPESGTSCAVGFEQDALIRGSNFDEARVSALGILAARRDAPDLLECVVEKPERPEEYRRDGRLWVTMNLWRFTPAIYDCCESIPLSSRGEYELPAAVQALIDTGTPVRLLRCAEGVLDLTSRADIKRLEELLRS
ncbi:MAG TPA: nucleotidyltransferase family protein [Armatimonadota bacterium]|nr:nucleotidyltransferase family protein [Armatimonadota bacterium]